MIILDENLPNSQREHLEAWRISFRQIPFEIGREGMKDDEIIPLLHQLNEPTFFTLDDDFFHPRFRHPKHCLVHLDVGGKEAAEYIRRTLKHPDFNTKAKRMGCVVRVSPTGLSVWKIHAEEKTFFAWDNRSKKSKKTKKKRKD